MSKKPQYINVIRLKNSGMPITNLSYLEALRQHMEKNMAFDEIKKVYAKYLTQKIENELLL